MWQFALSLECVTKWRSALLPSSFGRATYRLQYASSLTPRRLAAHPFCCALLVISGFFYSVDSYARGNASPACPQGTHEEWSCEGVGRRCESTRVRACVSNIRSCQIIDGKGEETWQGNSWGSCLAKSCNPGFRLENNFCVKEDITPDPDDQIGENPSDDEGRDDDSDSDQDDVVDSVNGKCPANYHPIANKRCRYNIANCSDLPNAKGVKLYNVKTKKWGQCQIDKCLPEAHKIVYSTKVAACVLDNAPVLESRMTVLKKSDGKGNSHCTPQLLSEVLGHATNMAKGTVEFRMLPPVIEVLDTKKYDIMDWSVFLVPYKRGVFNVTLTGHLGEYNGAKGVSGLAPQAGGGGYLEPRTAIWCHPKYNVTAAYFMHELGHNMGLNHGNVTPAGKATTDNYHRKFPELLVDYVQRATKPISKPPCIRCR